MVVRVVRASVDMNRASEARPLGQQLIAAYQSLPGFGSLQSGVDAQHARIISITTWETRQQAEGVRATITDLIRQYEALGVVFEEQEIYDTED